MEIKEFIQNFADQLDDTDAEVLTPETKFRELDDWSSLAALSIIAMVDEEYGVLATHLKMPRLFKIYLIR